MSSTEPKTTYYHHTGPWPTPETEKVPALKFLANYTKRIDSADYDCSWLPYYHPDAVFHDATGRDYVGGQVIWDWIVNLFAPFRKLYMESVEFFVASTTLPSGDVEHTIFGEWRMHVWPKETEGDEGKITIPRAMIFRIGKAEGEGKGEEGGEEVGFEGLQIRDVRLFYDRTLLVPLLKKGEGVVL
ncbi:hypothetical protein B0J14DRAFT_558504 [Halenospora varia]|nr:hypothetical protein B0J14DRAFT_558504 [Halenospora varia]